MLPIAFLNKKILGNGADLNSKDKILLIVGGVIMAGAFLFFTYNMAINKIINK